VKNIQIPQKIAILSNPNAGKGKAIRMAERVMEKLREADIYFSYFNGAWPKELDSYSVVWLLGGDGTVNYFINRYPLLRLPVALFRAGSGNDFAWKLYGDISFDEYFTIAMQGVGREVDAACCNGRYFINGAGVGFDGEVVKKRKNKIFFLNGHLSYLGIVLQNIFFYREQEMTVFAGAWQREGKWFMISVANGSRIGGGFLVAPQAKLDDEWLDILLIRPIGLFKRLRYLPWIKKGRHLSLPFIEVFREKKIIIESPHTLPAHLDGELLEAQRFEITLSPKAFLFVY
jgi:diacylglycerol kinase (ATP)